MGRGKKRLRNDNLHLSVTKTKPKEISIRKNMCNSQGGLPIWISFPEPILTNEAKTRLELNSIFHLNYQNFQCLQFTIGWILLVDSFSGSDYHYNSPTEAGKFTYWRDGVIRTTTCRSRMRSAYGKLVEYAALTACCVVWLACNFL